MKLSRLIFGCGSLMARLGRTNSLALLHEAAEGGVTHFDVARSYGYGEAESVVGDFLTGRRDRFTLTTKFGIAPPTIASGAVMKRIARGAANAMPALRPLMRRAASGMVRAGRFDSTAAEASVRESLRQLRTDYVDVLLMHEPSPEEARSEEMQAFLEACLARGMARVVGVALKAGEAAPANAMVVQAPWDVLRGESRVAGGAGFSIGHSVLSGAAGSGNRSDRSCTTLLAAALAQNPNGAIIFTSRSRERVRANLKAADARLCPPAEALAAVESANANAA